MLSDLPSERTRTAVDQAYDDFRKKFVCKLDLPDPPVPVKRKKAAAVAAEEGEAGPSKKVKVEKGEKGEEAKEEKGGGEEGMGEDLEVGEWDWDGLDWENVTMSGSFADS